MKSASSRNLGLGLSALALSIAVTFSGCMKRDPWGAIPINGRVTIDGKPLANAEILYFPVAEGQARPGFGLSDRDGHFSIISTEEIRGVVPGEYRIAISAPLAEAVDANQGPSASSSEEQLRTSSSRSAIPQRYSNPAESGLTDTVNESHSGFVHFDLKSE